MLHNPNVTYSARKEELTIKLSPRNWPLAAIVAPPYNTTGYVRNAVITEANWRLNPKRRLRHKSPLSQALKKELPQKRFLFVLPFAEAHKQKEGFRGIPLLAVRTRLELATPCVTGMYSNQAELPHRFGHAKVALYPIRSAKRNNFFFQVKFLHTNS